VAWVLIGASSKIILDARLIGADAWDLGADVDGFIAVCRWQSGAILV
jgi:hypothetical protein